MEEIQEGAEWIEKKIHEGWGNLMDYMYPKDPEPTQEEIDQKARGINKKWLYSLFNKAEKIDRANERLVALYKKLDRESEIMKMDIEDEQKEINKASKAFKEKDVREHARKYVQLEKRRGMVMANMTMVTTLQARISQVKVVECIGSVVDTVTESMNELSMLKDMQATQEKIQAFAMKVDNLESLQETMDDLIQLQEIEPNDSAEVENIVRTALNTNNVMVADALPLPNGVHIDTNANTSDPVKVQKNLEDFLNKK